MLQSLRFCVYCYIIAKIKSEQKYYLSKNCDVCVLIQDVYLCEELHWKNNPSQGPANWYLVYCQGKDPGTVLQLEDKLTLAVYNIQHRSTLDLEEKMQIYV